MAMQIASEEHGLTLEPTDHPRLPMMGPTGCIAPPHVRPLCTLHVCSISGIGSDPKDPKFTKDYFKLRNKIEREENKKYL